jgi:two-component system NtrC family sensor kinase
VKQNHYNTMRRIILGSMILVPLGVFFVVLGTGYYYFRDSIETSTISGMRRIVEDHRQMIEGFLRERQADLKFVLNSYSYRHLINGDQLDRVFAHLQSQSEAFVDLGVFDEKGIHVAYHGPYELTGRSYAQAAWFREVLRKSYYISDIFLGYRRVPHFIIALKRKERGTQWVIRATIDTHLFNELVEKVRIGKTGEAYILNEAGILQTERRSGGDLMEKDPLSSQYPASSQGINTFIMNEPEGEAFLYATTWLHTKKWLLVVRQEKADAFRALRSASYLILLIMFAGGTGIVVLAFYLTGIIIRRLQQADIEKEKLGEQLITASRLAELGEMAAGFAHEINNPLQIMKAEQTLIDSILSDLLQAGKLGNLKDIGEVQDSLKQVGQQIERCAEITQAILQFGRQSEPESKDLDLKQFIPQVTAMIQKKANVNGIAVRQDIATDIPLIHADSGQLQQVLLNLYNNAIDAVLAKYASTGGELIIETVRTEKNKVEIRVTDNGIGISKENLGKIFTPFFTTKPVGKGTGLGLSVCHGIIDHMGGNMLVASEKGVGTTFTIQLPAVP